MVKKEKDRKIDRIIDRVRETKILWVYSATGDSRHK